MATVPFTFECDKDYGFMPDRPGWSPVPARSTTVRSVNSIWPNGPWPVRWGSWSPRSVERCTTRIPPYYSGLSGPAAVLDAASGSAVRTGAAGSHSSSMLLRSSMAP